MFHITLLCLRPVCLFNPLLAIAHHARTVACPADHATGTPTIYFLPAETGTLIDCCMFRTHVAQGQLVLAGWQFGRHLSVSRLTASCAGPLFEQRHGQCRRQPRRQAHLPLHLVTRDGLQRRPDDHARDPRHLLTEIFDGGRTGRGGSVTANSCPRRLWIAKGTRRFVTWDNGK